MITPTVGRIVWVFLPEYIGNWPSHFTTATNFAVIDKAQPCAAMISYVHSDSRINVVVTDHDGISWPLRDLELCPKGETVTSDRPYATWMPYQKGQAAKTEALERKLKGPMLNTGDRNGKETSQEA